jgi:hypothetical protein
VATITLRFDLPHHFLGGKETRAGFVLLAAMLLSFLFIRTSSRLIRSPKVPWWPGSVTTSSGLHLHHLVWGIVTILLTGFLGFATRPESPWNEILAAAFGVGAGLTLDEFALWVYLRDVYWTEEGRSSLEAVVVACAIGALLMLGIAPLDVRGDTSSVTTLALTVLVDLLLAALAILKGKRFLGLIGIFIPPFSLIGTCRLASPGSPWARRFYPADGRKLQRATARFARIESRRKRFGDAIAGAPNSGSSG